MDSHDPQGPGPRTPSDAWLSVSDGLVAGVHHALNNRMAALTAVAQVLESDLPADHPLARALSGEMERLERTVSLLRAVPRSSNGHAEPVQLSDVTRTVAQLFSLHHAVRDVPCEVEGDRDVLPLWIDATTLTHALLVLTVVAGWHARGLGGGRVVVRCSGDADRVEVEVRAEGEAEGGAGVDEADGRLGRIDVRLVGEMLRGAGGEVERTGENGGGWAATARLLTLPAARRREAESRGS